MKGGVSFEHSRRLFPPPPAVVLPKSRAVFLAFGSFFLPFFKRDFRLKKKRMPFVAVPGALPHALSRPRSLRLRERSGRPCTAEAGGKAQSCARKGREKEDVFVEGARLWRR